MHSFKDICSRLKGLKYKYLLLILLLLFTLELSGRLLKHYYQDPEQFLIPHPEFGHFNKAGYAGRYTDVYLKTNSVGLRTLELPTGKKRMNEFRVFCLGDSRTFGVGLPDRETYPAFLQDYLKSAYPTRDIQVFNAGVPGFSSAQGYLFLKNRVIDYQPDLVIIAFGHNDRWLREGKTDREGLPHFADLSPVCRFIRSSGVFTLLKFTDDQVENISVYDQMKQFISATLKEGYSKILPQTNIQQIVLKNRVPLSDFQYYMQSIRAICNKAGIDVLFLNLPGNPDNFAPIDEAGQFIAEYRLTEALRSLKKVTDLNFYYSPPAHYYRGVIFRNWGEKEKAGEEMALADFETTYYPTANIRRRYTEWQKANIKYRRNFSDSDLADHAFIKNPRSMVEAYENVLDKICDGHRHEKCKNLIIREKDVKSSFYIKNDVDHFNSTGTAVIARQIANTIVTDIH